MLDVSLTPSAATVADARRGQELFERFGDRSGAAFCQAPGGLRRAAADSGPARTAPAWPRRPTPPSRRARRPLGRGRGRAGPVRLRDLPPRAVAGRAEAVGRRALEQFQALDDQWGVAQAQFSLAEIAKARGDLDGAEAGYEAALAAARESGPLWALLASLGGLGGLLTLRGDGPGRPASTPRRSPGTARPGSAAASPISTTSWAPSPASAASWNGPAGSTRRPWPSSAALIGWSVPHTLVQLGCAEARLGDLEAAEADLAEAAGLLQAVPQPATAATAMVGAALVALGRGRPERAARLLATAETVRERAGFAAVGAEQHEAALAADAVGAALDPAALAAAQAAGRALATDDALREVIASAGAGGDHRQDGQTH